MQHEDVKGNGQLFVYFLLNFQQYSCFLIVTLLLIAVAACYRAIFILRLVQRDKLTLPEFAEYLGQELQVAARDPVGERTSSGVKVLSMAVVYLNSRCKDYDAGFALSAETVAAIAKLAEGRVLTSNCT